MAKKPLKPPAVPAGARHQFFVYMQRLVVDNGDLSTTELGARIGHSHQAVYKALTGPKMPSRAIVGRLAEALGGDAVATEAAKLWTAGVYEERGLSTLPKLESATSKTDRRPASLRRDQEEVGGATRLDMARGLLGLSDGLPSAPQTILRSESGPASPGQAARTALANEISTLMGEVGGVAELFSAETVRSGVGDWMSAAAIPSAHSLINFTYELRLDEHRRKRLFELHAAAVKEKENEGLLRYAD
ncbi:hypothetical protein [Nocardia sp. NPDC052316]|uniref:hypothetical protein n=1 Tax=Nocardia sp. NPDC052316 TaxID=3364329 RepID=UPI0037CC0279